MTREETLEQNREAYELFIAATTAIPKILQDKKKVEQEFIKKFLELSTSNGKKGRESKGRRAFHDPEKSKA